MARQGGMDTPVYMPYGYTRRMRIPHYWSIHGYTAATTVSSTADVPARPPARDDVRTAKLSLLGFY